jgi:hypothetical protein
VQGGAAKKPVDAVSRDLGFRVAELGEAGGCSLQRMIPFWRFLVAVSFKQ